MSEEKQIYIKNTPQNLLLVLQDYIKACKTMGREGEDNKVPFYLNEDIIYLETKFLKVEKKVIHLISSHFEDFKFVDGDRKEIDFSKFQDFFLKVYETEGRCGSGFDTHGYLEIGAISISTGEFKKYTKEDMYFSPTNNGEWLVDDGTISKLNNKLLSIYI